MRERSSCHLTLSHEDVGMAIALDFLTRQLRLEQQVVVRVVGQWLGNDQVTVYPRRQLPQRSHDLVGEGTSPTVLKLAVDRHRWPLIHVGLEANNQRDLRQVLHTLAL